MPIDPSIPLGARPIQVADPLESYGRMVSLRALMQQGKMQDLQMQEAQRQMRADEQIRASIAKLGGVEQAMPEIMAIDPKAGMGFTKSLMDSRKSFYDQQESAYKVKAAQAARLGQLAGFAKDQGSYETVVRQAVQEGLIPQEIVAQLPAQYDPAVVQQFGMAAMSAAQQHDARLKEIADRRAAEAAARDQQRFEAQLPGIQADAQLKQATAAGQAPIQPYQQRQLDEAAKPKPGVDVPYSPAVEAQRRRIAAARATGSGGGNSGLVDAVVANPVLYNDLTPSAKTAIAPELAKRGFAGFGKQLSESAIVKLSDSRSAIASLRDLRKVLQDNEQFIGPISGLSAMNPWSDARKAQADIDRVKQRVGKALEGGVLRKEDEDKYKKILATLQDTPTTAIYKVDNIIASLENDVQTFIDTQGQAGRNVKAFSGAQTRPQAQAPAVPQVGGMFNGERVMKVTRIQ